MVILALIMTMAGAGPLLAQATNSDLSVAIEFATRDVEPGLRLLVDGQHSDSARISDVARALGAPIVSLEDFLTCPPRAPLDPCRVPEGILVLAVNGTLEAPDTSRVKVGLWSQDPMREEVHYRVLVLEVTRNDDDVWRVSRVIMRGSN